ncbi:MULTISPECIES: heavy-metal-associated domain-containing protein [Nitrosomonas]|uniref:Copper chaperone n=2 Tax=Nitrosomonas eutropha TaxID=916 RepID=A0ABX5M4P8_9PROT|nr:MULTISPECIES: heavy metal-associated domain-containing protein [Nitrosomonas]ABI60610.1 Heavy metal transport/detoxification protein [Nitrosomonas eutropha C91]MXS81187.1 heavy-metal-associated domain-containing protein [Nitrosomonas sp. GH22]PXV77509.1 copper chaperone [Nitrosomonas eutropha]SDW59530.1 copper chaperone [Nitrosomonas eutropha]SEJ05044.1 copper chaperone [Nitrosomonas eutropha]
MPTTIVHIKGMTCGGCVSSVKAVLEKIPGVNNVEVSLINGQAIVQHDGSREDIVFSQVIEGAGFEVVRQQLS